MTKLTKSIAGFSIHTIDVLRKIFFIISSGISLFFNLLVRPRIQLLYKDAGVPLSSEYLYISYIAIIGLPAFAFIPLKKTPGELVTQLVVFVVLGLVLIGLALTSVIMPIYTLTSLLK